MTVPWTDTKAFYARACFRDKICYDEVMEWKGEYGEGRFEYVSKDDGSKMTLRQVDQPGYDMS